MTTRRNVLLAGAAGVAAVAAYPVGSQIAWSGKDFKAPEGALPATDMGEGSATWRNWSELRVAHPQKIATPADEGELADILRAAPGPVRPVGSGHSFSPLVPTAGTIVDVSRFSGLKDHDPVAKTATIGAGTRLERLSRELAGVGLAMPNLPDIDVQTLAGSVSTATHGTGYDLQALHAQIEGYRLVTADGRILDIDRQSDPDMLAAGQVTLGALGVITQYKLKLVDSFALHRVMRAVPIDQVLDEAEELARQHRNFEFFYLPHTGLAGALTHDIFDGEVEGRPPSEDEDTLADLRQLRDTFGWSSWLRRKIAQSQFEPGVMEDVTDESWKLLANKRVTKFNESEYHIPLENGMAAVRDAIRMLESRNDTYFPVEVRFVKGEDGAWLSPFQTAHDISVAVHAAHDEEYRYLVQELGPMFRSHGGRPHWGKLHDMTAADLAPLYPKMADFRAVRRELDPEGKFLNPHLARIFGVEAA